MKDQGTSNGVYGNEVPGAQQWMRTYLQSTPIAMRNKRLDRFRTHLRTSSEEIGSYWARSVTPQGSRFQYKKTEPINQYDAAPDMLRGQTNASDYLESRTESLPPIQRNDPYSNPAPYRNQTPYREPERIHLPDIRSMEVRLTLADNSVVTLQGSPNFKYHFGY